MNRDGQKDGATEVTVPDPMESTKGVNCTGS